MSLKLESRRPEAFNLLALLLLLIWIGLNEEIRVLAPTYALFGIENSLARVFTLFSVLVGTCFATTQYSFILVLDMQHYPDKNILSKYNIDPSD